MSSFNKFQPRKTNVCEGFNVAVDIYHAPSSETYVIITFAWCGPNGSWKGQPRLSLNKEEFNWFTADFTTPAVGRYNRLESSSFKNGGVALARTDVWNNNTNNNNNNNNNTDRNVTITASTYAALCACKESILMDVEAAENYVSTVQNERFDSDKRFLQHIVAAWLTRAMRTLIRRACPACNELVDASNQQAHTCTTMDAGTHEAYRELIDTITIRHIASVLASNGINRPHIDMDEIVGDSDKDAIINLALSPGINPRAHAFLDTHASLHADLFKTVPEPSNWNTSLF